MSKKKTNYSEIDDIKQDIDSLKTNVIELTKHLKADGKAQTHDLKEKAAEQIDHIKEVGHNQFESFEQQIKQKPSQSVALAFVSGLLLSSLINRR